MRTSVRFICILIVVFALISSSCQSYDGSTRKPSLSSLIRGLKSDDDEKRIEAANQVQIFGEKAGKTIPYLIDLLGDDNRDVMNAA